MNPLLYLKAVIAAVGANVFPPLADWGVSALAAHVDIPPSAQTALSVLIVALLTGGSVYATPNKQPT